MTDIQSVFAPPQPEGRLVGHKAKIKHLLLTYSERGLTLEAVSQPRVMRRSVSVLKRYCREFKISFPDYTPNSMKVKPE
jgi:hypothetical protein